MKPARFPGLVKLRIDPELRAALDQAADRDKTSVSEFVRRELRGSVARRHAESGELAR